MFNVMKNDFDSNSDDILKSINEMLEKAENKENKDKEENKENK